MDWTDIACIVFACTTANHLGLIRAVIGAFFRKRETLPIVSCPRCLTFWCVVAYGSACCCATATITVTAVLRLLAISFLSAYLAIWLELAEGLIDKLYDYVYKQIYTTTDSSHDDTLGA